MRPVLWIPEIHVTKVVTDFLGGGVDFFKEIMPVVVKVIYKTEKHRANVSVN